MAAPSATARATPSGVRMGDGYKTTITFAVDPNMEYWEKSVKPPSLDGGDPIMTPSMHNDTWVTKHPRRLIDMGEVTVTCNWDPVMYVSALAILNVATTITVTFPNGATLAFYGYLQKFEPAELQDGEEPEATLTIMPTNADPTTCEEEAPVFTAGTGTMAC